MVRLGINNIVSGVGGLFRAEILHRVGGFDTGHGDDNDLTTMIRKQRRRLGFSFDAVVWTTVPDAIPPVAPTYPLAPRQDQNRLSKHRDQFVLGRYGFANAMVAVQMLLARLLLPFALAVGLLLATFENGPLKAPQIVATYYWITVIYLLIGMLIARDISRTPQPVNFQLVFLYPFYVISLIGPNMYAEFCEMFRIGAKHPYVPDHTWKEIPWW